MVTTAAERTERRHEVRRQAILAAAADEFARVGYDAATLERIGERVGLSKASLYHYVHSKERLLVGLLAQVTDAIAAAASVGEAASATERLRAFVRAHMQVVTTTAEGAVLSENLDALMTRTASDELSLVRRRHEDRVAEIVEAGLAAGEFRDVAVRPTVKLLLGALNAIPRWFDPGKGLTLDQLCDQMIEVVLFGLVRR